MSHRGYPSTPARIRVELEALMLLPDDAKEWLSFIRREMKLAPWLLPAVQAAVRQASWRTAVDPVAQITSAVHRLAIEMRLSNNKYNMIAGDTVGLEEE